MIDKIGHFDYAFRFAALGMCIVSLEGDYIKVNDAMCKILGYTEHDLLKMNFADITFEDDIEISKDNHEKALKGDYKTYQFQKRFLHKNQNIVWVIASTVLIRDETNRPLYFFSQIQDITLNKQFENLNKKFEYIFDEALSGNCFLSLDGKFLKINKSMSKILGYDESKILESNYKDFTHPDDLKLCEGKYNDALEKKELSHQYEKRYINKNGEIVWALISTTLVRDENKRPLYFYSQLIDISERKQYEEELKASQARYDRAVRGSAIGLWDWDRKSDRVYWSERVKEIFGIYEKDFKQTLSMTAKLVHPDDEQIRLKAFTKHIKHGEKLNAEYRIKNAKGHYVWIRVKGEAIKDDRNNVVGIAGSIDDINLRKKAEIALKEKISELERINIDLDTFAYIASHDLKEPLRSLANNALFISQDLDKDSLLKIEKRLDRIFFLCERMENLIESLLHFSKLKNSELILKKVDLSKIIHDVKLTMDDTFKRENVQIILNEFIPKLLCDEVTITQVFYNLINNAIKYNDQKKKIIEIGHKQITDQRGIPKYVIYVKDNGIGIPEDHHEDIFRMFKRLDNEAGESDGVGVGLSFVKKIIDRHNGQIWIESNNNIGSTFLFTLC